MEKWIEWAILNWETFLANAAGTILTITIIIQRTTLKRKVKQMNNLDQEEIDLIEAHRKQKAAKAAEDKMKLDPIENTEEDLLKEALRDGFNFIRTYRETMEEYKKIKKLLKHNKTKYIYPEDINKELEENEEI